MTTFIQSDTGIQEDVLAELDFDARVHPNEIGVRVTNGVVTLLGTVDSYAKRIAAQEAAHRVRGVRAVANELEVRLTQSTERTDEDIAGAAAQALQWNVAVPAEQIDITVVEGRVTLSGAVPWNHQRNAAETAIRHLTGVRGVSNQIRITPPPPAAAAIKHTIEAALVRSAETDARQITVAVDGSSVELRGSVRTWAERTDAERAAWSVPGVTEVKTSLAIVPGV